MTLEELRKQLDGIDRHLIELIATRQETIRHIASVKQSTGFPLRDFGRERQVLEGAAQNAALVGVSPKVAENVMRQLIRYSLTMQEQAGLSAQRSGNGQRALIIGGKGKMGNWFAQFLYSQGFDIEISDPGCVQESANFVDWREVTLDHDFIVVATPLSKTNAILHELAIKRPSGVIFDIASLKSPLRTGVAALQAAGLRVTSVHPMFGPDVDLLAGHHVVFIDLKAGDAIVKARSLFDPTMAAQVTLLLEEHDQLMAYVLGLSHAVNIAFSTAIARSGQSAPKLLEVAGTTFAAQFDVARRVGLESPDLYFEIQTLNDFGAHSLDALEQAVFALRNAVTSQDAQAFKELMLSGRKYTADRRNERREEAVATKPPAVPGND